MEIVRSVAQLVCFLSLAACGAAPSSRAPDADSGAASSAAVSIPVNRVASTHDWTRFGWDAGRSSASPDETGITAKNVATLRRQQVQLDGTVDASPIYLHGVRVNGGAHDVFFVTTTYGKTLAGDADNGAILRRYHTASHGGLAGSRRIHNPTPVADPDRD